MAWWGHPQVFTQHSHEPRHPCGRHPKALTRANSSTPAAARVRGMSQEQGDIRPTLMDTIPQ